MSYVLPINNNLVRPSTSKDYENGKFPASALMQVPNVQTKCLADLTAARAFEALFALAIKMLGIIVKDVGDFRTFQEQINLFVDRYISVSQDRFNSTPTEHRKTWVQASQYGYSGIYWIKNYAKFSYWPATAATPGTSNHGFGLALDVAEEYDSDTAPDPITEVFVGWLCIYAPKFGIYASLTSEKWHWQYIMGDDIPQAVLDYEQGNGNGANDMDLIPREQRLFDSRPVTAFTGSPLTPNQVLKLGVPDHQGATAAIVNITVDKPEGPGFLSKSLGTSCLNFSQGQSICNEVTVFLNAEGEFVIINGPTKTHIIVDLVGIWVPSS